jgi:hypothetical protein
MDSLESPDPTSLVKHHLLCAHPFVMRSHELPHASVSGMLLFPNDFPQACSIQNLDRSGPIFILLRLFIPVQIVAK